MDAEQHATKKPSQWINQRGNQKKPQDNTKLQKHRNAAKELLREQCITIKAIIKKLKWTTKMNNQTYHLKKKLEKA